MMKLPVYTQSPAWQKAMHLADAVYDVTRFFPRDERFGLTNQLRRASVSVASNIAEGQGRLTTGEFLHFLGMARGSLWEVQTQIEIAKRRQFAEAIKLDETMDVALEVGFILNSSIGSLRQRIPSKSRPAPDRG